ncbi:MAG: hypothetical protein AB1749_03785 [Pseudomonadota bacterium]
MSAGDEREIAIRRVIEDAFKARRYPCRYAGPSLLARHLASDAGPAIAPEIFAAAFDGLG